MENRVIGLVSMFSLQLPKVVIFFGNNGGRQLFKGFSKNSKDLKRRISRKGYVKIVNSFMSLVGFFMSNKN